MTVAHDIQSQGSSEVKICFFPPYFSQGSHRNLSLFRSGRMEVASRCYCHAHLSFLMKKNAAAPFPGSERRSKYSGQSVRAIPVRVLTVGKRRSQGVQLLVEEYKEKLKNYCSIEDVLIKSNPKNTGNVKAQIEAEDMLIMQQIKPGEWGSSRLVFCIGGPYGHGQQVRDRADVIIRLSSMVLNHQIALIVLLEQLYRAWTIIKGQKYHH
ncbi:putative RNA methyltransferase At5g10620 isoform X3 [Phoenix dactylifera]|uniref:RNA methyltransferase At5g10620 isoform X3 n=1 Tax=Phoenix dactylifera TaxID=42345 RepID=A0A8B7BMT4_PHODC|nr:putative RNA methyltransferase At5g10620 isoform X3 [Phoenix dactylifera]